MHAVFNERRYLIPFRSALLPHMFTDVLVIGTGVAGHRAALAASEHGDVIIASKGEIKDSNTYYAQGGVAAVMDANDTFESHVQDTLVAGADLCDTPVVKKVVEHAPQRIAELQQWGMSFDMCLR